MLSIGWCQEQGIFLNQPHFLPAPSSPGSPHEAAAKWQPSAVSVIPSNWPEEKQALLQGASCMSNAGLEAQQSQANLRPLRGLGRRQNQNYCPVKRHGDLMLQP